MQGAHLPARFLVDAYFGPTCCFALAHKSAFCRGSRQRKDQSADRRPWSNYGAQSAGPARKIHRILLSRQLS